MDVDNPSDTNFYRFTHISSIVDLVYFVVSEIGSGLILCSGYGPFT